MVVAQSIQKAFMNAALTGKDVNPEQLLASIHGGLGSLYGRLEGRMGAFAASTRPPTPPEAPKPLRLPIPSIFGKA